MRITGLSSVLLATPLKQPIRTAIHRFDRVYHVIVKVETDSGLQGTGLLFAQSAAQGKLFQAALAAFEDKVVGENPLMVEAVWQKLWKAMNFLGNSGVAVFAQSAIDTALWDIVGKAAGLPLCQLLGQNVENLPVYASDGLWLSYSLEELVAEAHSFVAQSFRAIKIRIGSAHLEDDIKRVRAVREAIGPDVKLIADANQGWDAATAIKFGRAVTECDLYWLEEPVPYYDLAASARVTAALDTPLATGESEYTYLGFARLAQEQAANIWMPDLQRVGGISGLLKIIRLAEVYNIPVTPHLFPEVSIHVAVCAPTCIITEYVSWWDGLFEAEGRARLVSGHLQPGTGPGLGLEIADRTIEAYRVG
jgi:L-alanine-DL-glutamate epimerase-like enolase superfamily enzyme